MLSASAIVLALGITLGAGTPPNVLLLSVDTLRADRLGCYGYPLHTTPTLDAFAASALLFEDAICEVPLTAPSMISMLTSRYPRMTGTTRNGLSLPADVPTVPEIFREAGYETFCVQSNWTLKRKLSAADRGFETYDDGFHEKRWGFVKPERGGADVTARTLAWLESRDAGRPFFAWVHYSDPHAPYEMHKGLNPSGKRAWRLGNVEKVRAKYDSEVAFTDAQIARVLERLPENTAVLFVADHGESLYEHDYLGHGRRIHQTGIHIPLIIRAAGVAPGRSTAPARGIDIGPTLLGLAGLPKAEGMLGVDLLREPPKADRIRVVETYGGAVPNLPGAKAIMADAGPMRLGVLHEGWKLIVSGRDTELYSLRNDPGELTNAMTAHPERVAALRGLIEAWDAAVTPLEGTGETLSEDDVDALEALGYIE